MGSLGPHKGSLGVLRSPKYIRMFDYLPHTGACPPGSPQLCHSFNFPTILDHGSQHPRFSGGKQQQIAHDPCQLREASCFLLTPQPPRKNTQVESPGLRWRAVPGGPGCPARGKDTPGEHTAHRAGLPSPLHDCCGLLRSRPSTLHAGGPQASAPVFSEDSLWKLPKGHQGKGNSLQPGRGTNQCQHPLNWEPQPGRNLLFQSQTPQPVDSGSSDPG